MAKFSIKNAKSGDANGVQAIVALAQQYVKHWTKTEAQNLAKGELVILPNSWGLQVGKHAVKNISAMWHVYNVFGELVESFTCKQSAVTYSILDQTCRYNMARELRQQDTWISKLEQDQTNYIRRRARALRDNDGLTADMLEARITESNSLLALARLDLEKTLNKAKYLKGIWE
jgi:hypothetical protein